MRTSRHMLAVGVLAAMLTGVADAAVLITPAVWAEDGQNVTCTIVNLSSH